MPTIKDIARLAGVSHGTVSNVLNGRGNVSFEKIKRVQDAARQLGYSPDDRARRLRQTDDQVIGIILPNLAEAGYTTLFVSISSKMQAHGYRCELYVTNDIPAQEEAALAELAGKRVRGAVLVSCQPEGSPAREMLERTDARVVALVRETACDKAFIGFDVEEIAARAVSMLRESGCRCLCAITGLLVHQSESSLMAALRQALPEHIALTHYQTDSAFADVAAFTCMSAEELPDAVFVTSPVFALKLREACIYRRLPPPVIITLSPTSLIHAGDAVRRIALGWKDMAHTACSMLLGQEKRRRVIFQPARSDVPFACGMAFPPRQKVRALMMDGPDTKALLKLLPDFTALTGIDVEITSLPYQELYRAAVESGGTDRFDVLRLDVAWLSSLAEALLRPFDPKDPVVQSILAPMLESVRKPFSTVGGQVYAFPFTPNVQLQFYRKDLFEDTKVRRQYYESRHRQLAVPENYDQYCDLLRFFSRGENPESPVECGASVVVSAVQCISGEFLPCFYAQRGRLFGSDGRPALSEGAVLKALKYYADMYAHARRIDDGRFWHSSVEQFTRGDTAMLHMFINHVYGIANLRKSRIAGQIGFCSVPGHAPLLGGGVLGVARTGQNPEAALEFIRWACSEHIALPFTLLGGISPCRCIYDNPDILDLYPWLSIVPQNLSLARVRSVPAGVSEYAVEVVIGTAVQNLLKGRCTPEGALDWMRTGLEALTQRMA